MSIIMKFIGISKKNNAQKREHNLLKPTHTHTHTHTHSKLLEEGVESPKRDFTAPIRTGKKRQVPIAPRRRSRGEGGGEEGEYMCM